MEKEDATVLSEYHIESQLGEGTYGVVFRARQKQTGALYAVKKLRLEGLGEGVPATAVREITLLQDLSPHPNIVRLLQVISRRHRLYLVFELMSSDLRKFIQKVAASAAPRPTTNAPWSAVPLEVTKHLTRQMLHALWFCHQNRIVHRDLKPGNVLVVDKLESEVAGAPTSSSALNPNDPRRYTCKLADFGLARTFELPLVTYTNEVVTLWYRAPEILLGENHYTPAVDVWSVGCIVGEMMLGRPLFRGESQLDQVQKIFNVVGTPSEDSWQGVSLLKGFSQILSQLPRCKGHNVPQLFDFTGDPEAGKFVAALLAPNPKDRPTAADALSLPWLTK
ncbi:CDC2-related protein kinase, putative [Bodo saltans]|uniref:CDC2-related protein kinase, putative n=1 Tax=Bodo saltans TaxID=75058 RepID=A0A0S4JZV2_BODSA|nr:CDC2-related protein kinase, putative [Bodo saltans]|eukprot:CUG94117.1 CDC2-related protein kinase, putative [Bodo saltans]